MADGETWQAIAAKKRESAYEKIPNEWRLSTEKLEGLGQASNANVLNIPRESGILSARELEITEKYDAVALLEQLASGKFSSTEVTLAFSKRAAIAQQVTCCLTETFFDEALTRAKYLDDYLAREGKPIGPLHGIPVSIKDGFNVPGVQASLGFVSFLALPPATEYSALPKLLLDLGAVLYVKTTIPQTLMVAESDNNVFGRTLNPYKLSLTSGGSSGGESALIAMRGSILGVGTDVGGSIRTPALCCGLFGFKPSANRVPYGGQTRAGRSGIPGLLSVAGPLATTLRDIKHFMNSVLLHEPWQYDSTAIASPWRSPALKKVLTIGVLIEDPIFPLHPPVARILADAVEKLSSAGHKIVFLQNAPSIALSNKIAIDLFSLDNSRTTYTHIVKSGEPVIPSVANILRALAPTAPATLEGLFDTNIKKEEYIRGWHEVFINEKIDVIIGPGSETTALPHDTYGNAPYTIIWNVLNYPALIIPYGKADKTIDLDEKLKSGGSRTYSAEAVDGAPTALQIVARNFFDEELLDAAAIILEVLAK